MHQFLKEYTACLLILFASFCLADDEGLKEQGIPVHVRVNQGEQSNLVDGVLNVTSEGEFRISFKVGNGLFARKTVSLPPMIQNNLQSIIQQRESVDGWLIGHMNGQPQI